jgi:3-phosphoshikimate 1-carboxyvinyltransferase
MPPNETAAVDVLPARRVRGRVAVPGDKSISHRYALLAALADGTTRIRRFAPGADCAATLSCLQSLGVPLHMDAAGELHVTGRGVGGLSPAPSVLDARNSGSTLRMLAGVLAAHPFESTLTGDASLRRRPMRRIVVPLERMGARLETDADHPPVRILGARLDGIEYALDVPSAQVKSAILLAGLQAEGTTIVREPATTRDHTELALRAFGAIVACEAGGVAIRGPQRLQARTLRVPGDLSSATFWAVAAAALPGSEIEIPGVGLNPTRRHVLDVLRRAGARVEERLDEVAAGEPVGTVRVAHGTLSPVVIEPSEVPALIDELPALSLLGLFGAGLRVTGAGELRAKESDRITALVTGLARLGATATELPDGFEVRPASRLRGGTADAAGDHRLAMTFALAGLRAERPCRIEGADAVAVSYPEFFEVLRAISEA